MRIVDIYESKQGEGLWTGVEAVFIRVCGCNLRCSFCDTPNASWFPEEGSELSVEEIASRILLYGHRHVVLTGGEPMIYSETIPLTRLLHEMKLKITIETAGSLDIPVKCDLMSISPKLSNSIPMDASAQTIRLHNKNRFRPEVIRSLIKNYEYQIKFVMDEPEDILEVEEYISMFEEIDPHRILLMPLAVDAPTMWSKADWIVPYCLKRGFQYCPRMQLEWFGNRRVT